MQSEIVKTIKVTDPEHWDKRDNSDTVTVKMFRNRDDYDINTWGEGVRIIFYSTGECSVYRDFKEFQDFEANWDWCKKWLWDRLPESISCEWLYEHGYVDFN